MALDFSHLNGKVIEFNQEVLKSEIDFEPGCRARVVNWEVQHEDDVLMLNLDFKEFEESNKKFLKANYYDRDSNPTLFWYETASYPKNCRDRSFFEAKDVGTPLCPFTVLEEDPVLKIKEKARDIRHDIGRALEQLGVCWNGSLDHACDEILIKHLSK